MATALTDIDEIRRKMAKIRRELHEDVRDVVEGAEAVSDWRHYVKMYPWAALGVAAGIGFLIVPKRKKTSVKSTEVAQAVAAAMPEFAKSVAVPEPKPSRGFIRWGLGMLAPVALRAAQNYATHFANTWMTQQQDQIAAMMGATGMGPRPSGPEFRPGPGPGSGPSPGVTPPRGPSQPTQPRRP